MVHTLPIGYKRTVSHTGIFDLKEVYKIMKSRFINLNYDLQEITYDNTVKEKTSAILKWQSWKKVDDYSQRMMKLLIKLTNDRDVLKNKKQMVDGSISITIEGFIIQDYDGRWERNIALTLMRSMYDKFIAKDKYAKYTEEIKEDANMVLDDVQSFLKTND
ncbi:hypothetical protein J4405_06155 [Candidatus Woesearchaeota archaeon]|nr:hypothetical protein [Candidatus Woesearchaeota archaeon]